MDISTADQFNKIRDNLKETYNITKDIDLSLFAAWEPIGTEKTPFTGVINGGGHLISGLKISNKDRDYVGLFGYCINARINDLFVSGNIVGHYYVGGIAGYFNSRYPEDISYAISNCHFKGSVQGYGKAGGIVGTAEYSYIRRCGKKGTVVSFADKSEDGIGGIAGFVAGAGGEKTAISECFHDGDITGKFCYCGGIVGRFSSRLQGIGILNCYHHGKFIVSDGIAGGICSQSDGLIVKDCYSAGSFTTGTATSNLSVGGIVGEVRNGKVVSSFSAFSQIAGASCDLVTLKHEDPNSMINCFALRSTLLLEGTAYKRPVTIAKEIVRKHFKDIANSLNFIRNILEWDGGIWQASCGNYPYPKLNQKSVAAGFEQPSVFEHGLITKGDGSAGNPYEIVNYEQLELVKNMPEKYYIQKMDIDFGSGQYSGGKGNWEPIGNVFKPFTGRYNGNGFIIVLDIDKNTLDDVGLFGVIGSKGVVKNLQVSGRVNGRNNVGAIAGYNRGKISNCFTDATVNGIENVGGIVGSNQGGSVLNSFSSTNSYVYGKFKAGGLVGENAGSILQCYTRGLVSGIDSIGGIAGINYSNKAVKASVSKCVSINERIEAENTEQKGRIAGENNSECIQNFASAKLTVAAENDKQGTGKSLDELKKTSFWNISGFWGASFGNSDDKPWCSDESYPKLYFM